VRRHYRKLALGVLALAIATVVGVACGGGSKSSNSTTAAAGGSGAFGNGKKGGTYRVGWEAAFGFTDAFDPTGEYLADAFAIYSNLMLRTLVGYNHVAGTAGNRIVPDLATSVPKPTDGGKTYTFKLKSGVKFGPPVDRAITSKDILYSMERLAKPANGAQYSFYFTNTIAGMSDYGAGKAKTISGIETPNNQTIVFHLTKPTGDFLYRMTMPATAPIPSEVGKCFEGKPGRYGRDVVSSGPYMIQGADKVSAASCAALKPMSGFNGQTSLTLVRNPSYDPKTDSPAARQSLPDEFVFTVDANASDIFQKIKNGELEQNVLTPPPAGLAEYQTNPSLKPLLKLRNTGDRTWYITMNLTTPPFDDIHIRKAMNLIIDKNALRKAWGGPAAGAIATHVVPDAILGNKIKGYDPYATPGEKGDVAKAKAEVKQSKYDTNHDGICDASACKKVLMIADARTTDRGMVPVINADAAKIGITFTNRTVAGAYNVINTTNRNIPISERPGWGKDYADALTFFQALFTSGAIIPSGNTNYSLVGVTPQLNEQKKLGIEGNFDNVPSVDSQFDACSIKPVGDARLSCWADLDKRLMTDVVPWVPYLWNYVPYVLSSDVTQWGFDQSANVTAYAHVGVT
jgi:peptide/nickel transport system substrate-binding protein